MDSIKLGRASVDVATNAVGISSDPGGDFSTVAVNPVIEVGTDWQTAGADSGDTLVAKLVDLGLRVGAGS